MDRNSYKKPVSELSGYKTLVRDVDTDSVEDKYPSSRFPAKGEEKGIPNTEDNKNYAINTPAPYTGLPTVKTLSIPGEQYGTPSKNTPLLTRRVMQAFLRRVVQHEMRNLGW